MPRTAASSSTSRRTNRTRLKSLRGDSSHLGRTIARGTTPGTDDLAIILQPDELTRFVVVDAGGAPVERFGLRIGRNQGEQATERNSSYMADAPRPKHQPGGIVELGARQESARFELYAPGYLKLAGEIEHDDGAPGQQTLRLPRGQSLTGRVLAGGAPVEGLAVTLTLGRFHPSDTDAGGVVQTFYEDREQRNTVATDAAGRFVLRGVQDDEEYALGALAPGRACCDECL